MRAVTNIDVENPILGLHRIEDYEPFIGPLPVERILKKAKQLGPLHVAHVSSTLYGGGVAEILTPLTLLMNMIGIETGWRAIQGTSEFFSCTKKIHNALQGGKDELSDEEKLIYEQVVLENAVRLHLEEHDVVVVHDPQPLPLVRHFESKRVPWIWQCHIDLSDPNPMVWDYLRGFVEQYAIAVFSLRDYTQDLAIPQQFILPAINPFSAKNRVLSHDEIQACLSRYQIPVDRPLVVQISRFDPWKDPQGVIEAVRLARKQVDCTLVLLGNTATDDPEGAVILEKLNGYADEQILILSVDDPILVNVLQRQATAVLQKSIREGFGLTVTEAMWKGAAVIGGNTGGIRHQIKDGENGFLVDTPEEAAERIVHLVKTPTLRQSIGIAARETVRQKFLLSRLAEDWIDLLGARAMNGADSSKC
jgi:trehalose synthase